MRAWQNFIILACAFSKLVLRETWCWEREIVRIYHALRRQREPSCNRFRNFKPFHFEATIAENWEVRSVGVVSG